MSQFCVWNMYLRAQFNSLILKYIWIMHHWIVGTKAYFFFNVSYAGSVEPNQLDEMDAEILVECCSFNLIYKYKFGAFLFTPKLISFTLMSKWIFLSFRKLVIVFYVNVLVSLCGGRVGMCTWIQMHHKPEEGSGLSRSGVLAVVGCLISVLRAKATSSVW